MIARQCPVCLLLITFLSAAHVDTSDLFLTYPVVGFMLSCSSHASFCLSVSRKNASKPWSTPRTAFAAFSPFARCSHKFVSLRMKQLLRQCSQVSVVQRVLLRQTGAASAQAEVLAAPVGGGCNQITASCMTCGVPHLRLAAAPSCPPAWRVGQTAARALQCSGISMKALWHLRIGCP